MLVMKVIEEMEVVVVEMVVITEVKKNEKNKK